MRAIHQAREFLDREKIVYQTGVSDGYKNWLMCNAVCCCNPVICCKMSDLIKSTYITVYETKLEYNYPSYDCCCTEVDYVSTVYFDRDLTDNVDKAGCCQPCFTHNMCFPTCCDCCGEAIVLHGNGKCACTRCCNPDKVAMSANPFVGIQSMACCCCTKPHIMLTSIKDAAGLSLAIRGAVANARGRASKGMRPTDAPGAAPIQMIMPTVQVNVTQVQPAPHMVGRQIE